MTTFGAYFCSTIGRKQMMAVAGLIWAGFLVTHAAANATMLFSSEVYNMYGHNITSNPLLYVAEAALVFFLLIHVFVGIALTVRNGGARNTGYAKLASGEKRTSWTTRTMWIQGIILLGFIILHLITFKYGKIYEVAYNGVVVRDLFKLVWEVFQSPMYVIWYIVALLILCFHTAHGIYSGLQTLGANHPKYTPIFKKISVAYGVIIAATFIAQPIYMMFIYKG